MASLKEFLTEESGQGLVEYSLIISIVVIGAIGVLTAFSGKAENMYIYIMDRLSSVFG